MRIAWHGFLRREVNGMGGAVIIITDGNTTVIIVIKE